MPGAGERRAEAVVTVEQSQAEAAKQEHLRHRERADRLAPAKDRE